jgi:hypothetical protein
MVTQVAIMGSAPGSIRHIPRHVHRQLIAEWGASSAAPLPIPSPRASHPSAFTFQYRLQASSSPAWLV